MTFEGSATISITKGRSMGWYGHCQSSPYPHTSFFNNSNLNRGSDVFGQGGIVKKFLTLWLMVFGLIASKALAAEVSIGEVVNPGPNFQIFQDRLTELIGSKDVERKTDVDFFFLGKGKFEVWISVPSNGDDVEETSDKYFGESCYSLGIFELIPKPDEAKKLASLVAKKFKNSPWKETSCGE